MVLKSASVLSCLLPARLGFGSNHRRDPPRDQEKHAKRQPVAHRERERGLVQGDNRHRAPHTVPDLPRARANTAPSDLLSPPPPMPDGGIGESPGPAHRSLGPPNRSRRTSCTTFFAFSSKRRSTHGPPIVHIPQFQQDVVVPSQPVHGRWVPDTSQAHAQLINPSSIPSPLQADDEEYYYSYYTSYSPRPSTQGASPSKRLSLRRQDLVEHPDLDSQHSSPVNTRPSHTLIHHPYAYSNPLASISDSKTDITPPLRHVSSQPLRHPRDTRTDLNTGLRKRSSQLGCDTSRTHPNLSQRQLKTSVSTPNLTSGAALVRPRSLIKKKPPKPKGSDRLLSAETWWDALLSPSPRFKVRQAPQSHTATARNCPDPVTNSVEGEANRNMGVTFPSAPPPRPRAVSITSVASNTRPTHPTLARSRSAADLLGRPSTSAAPHAGLEPALEMPADEPSPTTDQTACCDAGLSLPEPPLSLEQVIDEGEAFEQQRAQWKQQAAKSLGNRHSRSISRARSKSLGAKHAHGHHTSESSKAQFNFEFFAARTLLGSQSTMPTVHVTQPSDSHLKAYSHSHSHSACSCSHTSHSRAYSHSHSHSLTTSNSSKSSRNLLPRGHSRNGSRSKFLKAGVLCGIGQDESHITSADEEIPSSSRAGVQGVARMGGPTNVEGASDGAKVSPPQSIPGSEVGIAISSSPLDGSFDVKGTGYSCASGPRHREGDQESHRLSRQHKSFEYAGPHPSAVDSNLAQVGVASYVSLRHRLPPRAAVHPIPHPYRSAAAQPEEADNKDGDGAILRVAADEEETSPVMESAFHPHHLSLNHADFEQYGVGEALVYASYPPPEVISDIPHAQVEGTTTVAAEVLPLGERPFTPEAIDAQPEELDTSSLAVDSPPSLTSSTVRMVMSALDNPDHLDEFKDLFYKPLPPLRDQHQEPSVVTHQVPTDVCGSVPSSPVTHLVRKLNEGIHGQGDASRTPFDSQNELQNLRLDEGRVKFVFMDLARSSSSSPPIDSSSQTYLPIQKGSESTAQPATIVPEDVNSFYATSVSESPLEENENDTFGYPIKHGQFEAATAPSPTRLSAHLSVQKDGDGKSGSASLSPLTTWHRLSPADAVRSSYVTVSDVSQMSTLSDFPLPPSTQLDGPDDQMSILRSYYGGTPSSDSRSDHQRENEYEMDLEDQYMVGEEDEEPAGDVDETLRALRMTSRITSFESRRSTFGGSDDMEFATHQGNA